MDTLNTCWLADDDLAPLYFFLFSSFFLAFSLMSVMGLLQYYVQNKIVSLSVFLPLKDGEPETLSMVLAI